MMRIKKKLKELKSRIKMKLPVTREEYYNTSSQIVQVVSAQQEHLTMTRNDLQQLASAIRQQGESPEQSEQSNKGGMYR